MTPHQSKLLRLELALIADRIRDHTEMFAEKMDALEIAIYKIALGVSGK